MSATLNDLDIANPLSGSTIDELAAEVRSLKTIIKNVLLVAHENDGSIVTGAVTEVAAETVDTAELVDGAVTAVKLDTDSVETAKIKNLAVTGAKIAAGALNAGHFSSLTSLAGIPSTAFGDASIELSKLATTLTTDDLTDGCVTTLKIADANVTDAKIVSLTASKLTGGTDGQTLVRTGGVWTPASAPTLPNIGVAIFGDDPGASGGGNATVAETWNKRVIGVISDTSNLIFSIVSQEMTLVEGTYFIFVRCPAHEVKSHQCRLVQKLVADPFTETVIAVGSSAYAFTGSTEHAQTDSILFHTFTVAEQNAYTYFIEHYLEVVAETDDLGAAVNASAGDDNLYTSGFLFKIP